MRNFIGSENDLINFLLFHSHFQIHKTAANPKRKMHSKWFNVLKTLFVLLFVLLINTKYLTYAEELSNEESDDGSENLQIQQPDEMKIAKRAWSQLQGSWGKRDLDDYREGSVQSEDYPDKLRNYEYEPTRLVSFNLISDSDDFEESQPVEKRAWNSMNGAWGKRTLNKFRGTGKREPGGNWNNLRGLWGKRSNDLRSWNKLSSAWGK